MQLIGINMMTCGEYIRQYTDVRKSKLLQGDVVVRGMLWESVNELIREEERSAALTPLDQKVLELSH